MSTRIEYIDIARGVGILLVVMGHNDFGYISSFAYQTIYSFHMPLFFFLSGYFLNVSTGFFDFVKKRFDTLIKPYLFTIFIIYFTSISFEKMGFRTAIFRITKSLYGVGHYLDWVQLWFLPHLFVVSLYAYFVFRLLNGLNNRMIKWVILFATLWISTIFLQKFYPFSTSLFGKDYELYGLPLSLDLVGLSGFFFILGSEIRRTTSEKLFEKPAVFLVSGASLILLNIFFHERIDLNTRVYESFLINTLEAVAGIFFILALSRQIELRTEKLASLFKYFGQISLFILIFHVPIQDFWGQKILAVSNNLSLSIWCGFIMGVAGSVLIYELFIKANPVALWWFGRKVETPEQKTVLTKS